MCRNDIVIDRVSLSDVTGILKLAQANDAEHGGMLLGHLEPEAVMITISKIPSVVARKDGQVIGFLIKLKKSVKSEFLFSGLVFKSDGMVADMIFNKTGDEIITVVIAFLVTQV